MDRRKSLGLALLTNSIELTDGNASPLRRRSSFGLTAPRVLSSISENDDEAERLARRQDRRPELSESSVSSSDKRRSLGLSNIAHIPATQISEKISHCIKLSTENKINVKNAFSLEIIDFMTYLIKKKDREMSNLQVASTSLDVSAKIYGFRVDGVHNEILKMIGGLDKQDKKNDDENDAQGENNAQEGAEKNNEEDQVTQKKKKKRSRNILSTVESLRTNVDAINPISLIMGDGDSQTTDLLFQAMLPYHENDDIYLHSFNDVILDTIPVEKSAILKEIEFANAQINNDLDICPSFSNFQLLGWSADNEPVEDALPHNESKYQFDLDASLPLDDVGNSRMDIFDMDDDHDEEVNRFRGNAQVENIVDFSSVIASSGPKNNFEYSYLQDSLASQIQWVGPLHWKVRLNKSIVNSRVVGAPAACKDTVRKKKEVEVNQRKEEFRNAVSEKFLPGHAIKLQVKTAKTGWAEDKITFPKNEHYDTKNCARFYFRQKYCLNILKEKDINTTHLSDEVDNYNYNNDNDVSNYCPNIQNDDYQVGDDNDNGVVSGFNSDCDPGIGTQGIFAGDNLVAAPKLANKIFIPYSLRAKKIDMRQLKKTIWKCLTRGNSDKENIDIREAVEQELSAVVKDEKHFCTVYKELPKHLSKSNAEALSLPIAFVSLLHLANEKNLEVKTLENLADLLVKQN